MSGDKPRGLQAIWAEIKDYLELNIEYAKLTAAEKLTILLTSAALAIVSGVLAVLIVFFVSIAGAYWLAQAGMSVALAYTIVAGFYVLMLVVIFLLRKQLLINPIAKFITKLFLK